jgi:hypothetical protein
VLKDLLDVADIEEYTYKTSHLPTESINRRYLNFIFYNSRDLIVNKGSDILTKSEIFKYSYDMPFDDILNPLFKDLQENTGRTKVLEVKKNLLETFWDTILEGAKKVGTKIEYEKIRNEAIDKLAKITDDKYLERLLKQEYKKLYREGNKLFSTEL